MWLKRTFVSTLGLKLSAVLSFYQETDLGWTNMLPMFEMEGRLLKQIHIKENIPAPKE